MIFASDLDQTILFGKRFITESNQLYKVVEMLDGIPISHMSVRAIQLLKEVHKQLLFVPVTTRTREQYCRIDIFQEEITPRYAITSNGGNVLIEGRVDEDWHRRVVSRMNNECGAFGDILERFAKISNDTWVIKENIAEHLFFYSIIDREKMPFDELAEFSNWIEGQNWSMSIQGRKLYLVPQAVNKRDAVHYVSSLEDDMEIIAAGDSLLDMPLLEIAGQALVPPHGELYQFGQNGGDVSKLQFTLAEGISSSEEILQQVLFSFLQITNSKAQFVMNK